MEHLAHVRKSGRQVVRQRSLILMASVVYTPVAQIARICRIDAARMRKVIHALNEFGSESLNQESVLAGRGRLSPPSANASWPSPWHRRAPSASH